MPQYIRAFVPGGTFFFTVTLLERRRKLLTEHIDDLRAVIQAARIPGGEGLSGRRLRKGERGIWQRRFWEHVIVDDRDFDQHVDYIHYNPVKHGLVERASQWPFSSFHRYVRRGIYTLNWAASPTVRGLEME